MHFTPRKSFFLGLLAWALAASPVPVRAVDGSLTPEQALAAFQTEPGLTVELVAAEPMVISPVAVCFDEKGRMYVAENRGYPVGPGPGQPPAGKVALLEDTNGDGKYDRRTTFAEGLTFPNGIMPWKGGVFVTCAPDVYYFKDTNGDGVADVKIKVFTGFQDASTTQLRVSHPVLGMDNKVYLTSGLTSAKVKTPEHPERPVVTLNRTDARFDPETWEIEEAPGTAQFGQTFDSFGRRFICSNRNHLQHVVLPPYYLRRNPNLAFSEIVQDVPDHGAAARVFALSHNITTAASHAGFFTSACGVTIYGGRELPPPFWGSAFTCEPAGNLIHRDVLSPSGVTFVGQRATEGSEFLASPDNWFRPVNLANGADGALYICDMYRKTIEHPDYLPEATRKETDFESGKDRGRIYRVYSASRRFSPRRLNLDQLPGRELCLQLDDQDEWWRNTAHRLLLEKKDRKLIPHLQIGARSFSSPEGRIHALWLLDAFHGLTDESISHALQDKMPLVREAAVVFAERRLAKSPKLAEQLSGLAGDPEQRVRFQCALSLGEIKGNSPVKPLARIAIKDAGDRWSRAAVLSGLAGREPAFLREMTNAAQYAQQVGEREVTRITPMLADFMRTLKDAKALPTLQILQTVTAATSKRHFQWQLVMLGGLAEARPMEASFPEIAAADTNTLERVKAIMERSVPLALEEDQPLEIRLAALRLLAHDRFERSSNTLAQLLEPRQPSEIQLATVRALVQMGDSQAVEMLLQKSRWQAYTPSIKDAVFNAVLSQSKLTAALLAAVERGDITPTSINPEKRNQLMKHKDPALKKRAEDLFKDLKPSDRMKVYEELKSVLTVPGQGTNGHRIFSQTCATCHTFAGEGHLVGPDLTGIRSQAPEVILLHILVPEAEIMPIYTQYNVETKDGQSYAGILISETPAAITIRQSLGLEEKIPRTNIATMKASSLSLMPQELEKTMSKQDLADLLAFLKGNP